MKTILVTGGSGFLGSNLCKKLLLGGNKIICIDNNYTGSLENISELRHDENFLFIEHDVVYPLDIEEKIDEIYHLACPASPPFYQGEHSIHTTKTSVIGSINMLDLAFKHSAKILLSSTSECYGDPQEHPQKETYNGNVNPIGIRSCYDEGKRCAESLFFDYYRYRNVNIRVVRIFNTYGIHMNPLDGRVVSNFICQAIRGDDITIYGDGSQTRSFCYVDDLLNGLIEMMDNKSNFVGPVNLGNPEEITIKELSEKIISKIDTKSKIIYKELPSDDPMKRKPDISLAREILEWEPKIKLEQGLDKTINYFKKKLTEDNLYSCLIK